VTPVRIIAAFSLVVAAIVVAVVAASSDSARSDKRARDVYQVKVRPARFAPGVLARDATMTLAVANVGERPIPGLAVSVRSFAPAFLVVASRPGTETASPSAYVAGRVAPTATAVFRWRLRALKPGPYRLRYALSPNLSGTGRVVLSGGRDAAGVFAGRVRDR
jgi:hypothetical protein